MQYLELVHNLTLLVALSLVSGFLHDRWGGRRGGCALQGLLFGAVSVLGMQRAMPVTSGIFLDGRSVMLSLGALFFGPQAAGVALAMVLPVRIWMGGQGALAGCLVSILSGALGLLFRAWQDPRQHPPRGRRLLLLGLLVHGAMGAVFVCVLSMKLFQVALLPLVTLYPAATVLAGKVLSDTMQRSHSEQQLRLKNEALVRSHEEMDRLIYNTSHDLRAPLRATLGLLELQEDPETTAEERGENHRLMRASLERCDRIIRDILEFSRSSRCSSRPERVYVEALVQECLENLRPIPEASRVHFEVDVPLDLSILIDQPCLRSILQSLLTNAVQFQRADEPRPRVSIRASEVQGQMELQVEDNGEGIPAPMQEEVFRMFYRGSHRSQGSGLGLYFARQMAQRLGGQVNLESSQGVGSTFTLRLPLTPEVG